MSFARHSFCPDVIVLRCCLPTACLQAQLRAASALRGLSVTEQIRAEIVKRGGLVPLLRLGGSDDVELQMEVTLPFTCDRRARYPGGSVLVRSVTSMK